MINLFIHLRFVDIIDILLVSILMFQIYELIRGTVALNIVLVIFVFYLGWLIVRALNMELMGAILDKVISVGIIALIIVFQQEIRRFLIFVGSRYLSKTLSLDKLFSININERHYVRIKSITNAAENLSKSNTGALIVIARKSELDTYAQTGQILNADTSSRILISLFFKNSPMHDGAAIVLNEKILAAKCILPVSDNPNIPVHYGLRHRAGLGISEVTDAIAVIVSEETGEITLAEHGKYIQNVTRNDLFQYLEKQLLVGNRN